MAFGRAPALQRFVQLIATTELTATPALTIKMVSGHIRLRAAVPGHEILEIGRPSPALNVNVTHTAGQAICFRRDGREALLYPCCHACMHAAHDAHLCMMSNGASK